MLLINRYQYNPTERTLTTDYYVDTDDAAKLVLELVIAHFQIMTEYKREFFVFYKMARLSVSEKDGKLVFSSHAI